jgi:hypothetical protein
VSHVVKRCGIEINLAKERHTGCPFCISKGRDRSRNNMRVYGLDDEGYDLGAYCFACDKTIPPQQIRESSNEEEVQEDILGSEFNDDIHSKLKEITNLDGKLYRGIRKEINKFFGVRYMYDEETGDVERSYYPCTTEYELTGYKVRTHPKNFKFPGPIGETGKGCDLFGQFRFKTNNHTVLLTGGEVDCLSAYQMLLDDQKRRGSKYNPPAVVSATVGESGAWKQVQGQYQWFNQFKKIIVCMDEDAAGKEATEKICKVLPKGKVHVMNMRCKDPNEYIDKGLEKDFIQDYWAAKAWTPAGVHASTDLYRAALEYTKVKQLSLPPFLKRAEAMFNGGLVKNELTCIFASTSVGKSLFVDNMVKHWILTEPDELVGVMSLEATKDKYATNILSRYLEVNLSKMTGEERRDYLLREDVKDKVEHFLEREDGTPRFYVYDSRGASVDETKEAVLEMIIRVGITILVWDVYSDTTAGLDLAQQEELTAWLKKLILEYPQLSIIMVCHTRKHNGKDNQPLTESDIIGSSTVMKSAAQTISLERDKLSTDPIERNTTHITIHKNRHFSHTGPAGKVYYDPDTGLLHDFDDWVADNPELADF